MNQHPYLRAYLAGIAIPTVFLVIGMTAFTMARYVYGVSIPIERVIVFPMAVIPNLWGLWNILYVWLRGYRQVPIGFHGSLLVILIVPLGRTLARLMGFEFPPHPLRVIGPLAALVVYYLIWKYAVSLLNRSMNIG